MVEPPETTFKIMADAFVDSSDNSGVHLSDAKINRSLIARKTCANHDDKTRLVVSGAEILPTDILMGRGARMIQHAGNVRFRAAVETHKDKYNSTRRHHRKQAIAQDVLNEIVKRHKGRFLRKLDLEEADRVTSLSDAWVLADPVSVLDKIKQTLRDKLDQRPKSASCKVTKHRYVKCPTPAHVLDKPQQVATTATRETFQVGTTTPRNDAVSVAPIVRAPLNGTSSWAPLPQVRLEQPLLALLHQYQQRELERLRLLFPQLNFVSHQYVGRFGPSVPTQSSTNTVASATTLPSTGPAPVPFERAHALGIFTSEPFVGFSGAESLPL